MTTVLADARLGVMVSDSSTSDPDTQLKWPTQKIFEFDDALFGVCGDSAEIDRWLAWMRSGRKGRRPRFKESSVLELARDGLFVWDNAQHRYSAERDCHAVGGGAMAALAAVECGKTPEEAVEIACRIHHGSEGPLQIRNLKEIA